MPETSTASKTNTIRLHSCLTKCKEDLTPSHSAEKNAIQCVKRRLQYSQLPVRCQKRPYCRPAKSPFKLPGSSSIPTISFPKISTAKNSSENLKCSPGSRVPITSRCKKSISMIDLSPVINDPEFGDLRLEGNNSNSIRREEMEERKVEALGDGVTSGTGTESEIWLSRLPGGFDCQLVKENKAADLVCHVLVKNAWRRRREEVAQLQETIQQLNQQVDHLHIQIAVLRRLLETEKGRVGRLTAETNHVKMQLNEVVQEREALKVEKENLESQVQSLKESSEEKSVGAENLRNQLLSAESQLEALDGQISRDREKLLKLREDKKILLEKTTASEALANERGLRAEKAESENEELKLKLIAQITLVASAQEKAQMFSKELKAKEGETEKLEEQLKFTKDAERTLSLRATSLESQLSNREAALRRVETAYNSQISELNELRERLIRQSQEGGWSSRVLQIAGSVVRAPRAILRTLSFLSHSGTQMV